MKRLLCFSFILFGLMSCSNDDSTYCCTNISTDIYIKYVNEAGENLLETEEGFDENSMISYENIDGEWKYMQNSQPSIVYINSETYLKGFLSLKEKDQNFSETKIKIGDKEHFFRSELTGLENGGTVIKIWYEDSLIWDVENNEGQRFIEIER